MSSYGYPYKGYSSQNGVGSYVGDGDETSYSPSDHVCKPVLIDAEGRKRPIISYNTPNNCEYHVSKTEAIVRTTVHSPLVYDYKQSLPTRVEPARTYGGVADGKWVRPSSPVRRPTEDKLNTVSPINGFSRKADEWNKVQGVETGFTPLVSNNKSSYPTGVKPLGTNNGGAMEKRGNNPLSPVTYSKPVNGVPQKVDEFNEVQRFPSPQKVEEFVPKVEPDPTRGRVAERGGRPKPDKFNEFNTREKSYRPSSPIGYSEPENVNEFINPEEKWHRSTSPIRQSEPDKVKEFINNIQTDASRPKFPPLSATYGRQTPSVSPRYGYDYDLDNKVGQSASEPAMIIEGGRSRPSQATWASPPEGTLTKPTNDINTAMAYLLESAKPSSRIITPRGSRVTVPVSKGFNVDASNTNYPKNEAYTTTIDSREAARRYGDFNSSNSPKNEPYTTSIDSREAARKYGGRLV